jgi:CHAD domain-containing protein
MTVGAHEVLERVLSELVADVRASGVRVITAGDGAGGDAEAVHDFRVALRRLRTLLRVARKPYGERRIRAIGESLGRFADATGALRDEEVLRQVLAELELPDEARAAVEGFAERRARVERSRRAGVIALLRADVIAVPSEASPAGGVPAEGAPNGLAATAADGLAIDPAGNGSAAAAPLTIPADGGAPRLGEELERALIALERRLDRGPTRKAESRRGTRDARHLGRASLRRAVDDVRACAGADVGDVAAMHALRIRFKRLRYVAELFAPLLGEAVSAAAKAGARMQKRLGELHDFDEALAKVGRARAIAPRRRDEVLAALRMARARAAVRCLEDLASALDVLAALDAAIDGAHGAAGTSKSEAHATAADASGAGGEPSPRADGA